MRKWLLIGLTLVFLIAIFAALMYAQRGVIVSGITEERPTAATRQSPSATQMGSFGRTQAAWVMTYDKRTGLPQARFRGEQFTPQQGDQVLVERPQVEFFLGKERTEVVRIVGKTGLVIMPGAGPRIRSDFTSTPSQAPSRGEMRDVTVTYFPTQQAAAANRADMTLTLDNAYFDSDLYEIATESYVDIEGNTVAGKDVPVILTGESFEFDGRGLLIRWDEHSQRLKSLTIFKGHQLVIKRPSDQLKRQAKSSASPPLQFVATDNKQAIEAAAQKPPVEQLYRATFHDGVIMSQDEKTLATSPQMHVDFFERSSQGEVAGPTATTPAKAPAAKAPAKSPNATGVNSEKPIVIRWGGQMTVTPAPDEALKPESSRDAVVRFAGTAEEPVHLYGNGGEIVASSAAYHTERELAWIEGSEGRPVRLTDSKGSVLLTPQLRYSQRNGRAVLRGPSNALVKTQKDGKTDELKASWRDFAEALFVSNDGSQALSSLSLKGDVKVEHPRIRQFNAGVLTLDFDSAKSANANHDSSAQVRQITASDHVICVIEDEKKVVQSIRAENLKLLMAKDGKGQAYPSQIDAAGSVVAGNALEQIQADAVQAELDPPGATDKEASAMGVKLAGLNRMVATGNVKVTSTKAQTQTITGDRLQVRQSKDNASWVVLEGAPATVTQGQTLLSGSFIELDTERQKAITTGGGRLVATAAKQGAAAKGQPMEITWTGDGKIDGEADQASIAGNVVIKYIDADGAINEAAGDRVEIGLGKKEKQASTTQASKLTFLSGRYAKKLTLLPSAGKDVRLQSLLPGPGGTIVRQINILGPQLDCYMSEEGMQRVDVPAQQDRPGRLLFIDLPLATRKALPAGDPLKTRELPGSTALAWHELLSYDKAKKQTTVTGGVMVRHEPQTPGGKKFQVDAQKIVADLVNKKVAGPTASAPSLEVGKITLSGSPVHLIREDTDLTAPLIEINPSVKTVMARGTQQSAVDVEKGRMTGSFEWVEINSESAEMKFGRAMATGRQ